MGLTSPFYGVQNALFQEQLPPEYLGRVFSLLGSVMSFAMPLGLLCSGIFAELIGVEKWLLTLWNRDYCGCQFWFSYCQFYEMLIVNSQNSFARKSDD